MNDLKYTVRRSQRKTIVLTVAGGKIEVRAPYGMSDEKVAFFVESKRNWIEKKLRAQDSQFLKNVRDGKTLLDGGRERSVFFNSGKNYENENCFYLKNSLSVRRYFEKTRGPILVEALHDLSLKMKLFPEDVTIRDFKARWGSCDAARRIQLNWRLSMLPINLRDYVLIHELCHLAVLNHSASFWKLVERFCPDFKECKKALKNYSFLTLLYR